METDKRQYLLAIDNGTQSIRALVFDQDGQLVAKTKIDIEPYFSAAPGWAEQDPQYFWASVCEACQQLWPQLDFPLDQIKAVSVSSQRGTVVPVDVDGQPVCPAISWLDQRRIDTKPKLGWLNTLVISLLRATGAVEDFYTQAEANWLAQEQPEIWQRVHKYLLLSGYHTFRLTGRFTDAVAGQVGYLPFDFKAQKWADKNDWTWRALPLQLGMLPDLLPAGETLGHITAQASLETGIPEGLPLIASGSDKACEVLGAGCLEPGTASLSYGTTATFNVTTNRYMEPQRGHPAYPGVVPNTYNPEMMVRRGYWMVSWFKKEFGLLERGLAAEQGVAPETLFDDLLRSIPPGSMGLMLQPYWSAGADSLGPEAKGAIIGFGEVHTRAHIYRAMIEGITYALREGKESQEKRSGQKVTRLSVSGGGSQSDEVMQITADIFGMTVERPHTFETSGLGAAMAAAVGAGIYPDFVTAVARMSHKGDSFSPVVEHQRIYDQLYKEVYCKMYGRLRPSYRAIQAITGYPA
ncbi:MAG: sugar (pentulose or hexulose) kinase [Halieaceae bacterium]|jgi:sugar (pentulose or hexulose) kinase